MSGPQENPPALRSARAASRHAGIRNRKEPHVAESMGRKVYLGDGAYVDFDGYGLSLTTENGISTTNEIYLEPSVYAALVEYVARLKKETEIAESGT